MYGKHLTLQPDVKDRVEPQHESCNVTLLLSLGDG